LAARATFSHFTSFALMKASNCSGVPPTGSTPWLFRRSVMSGSFSTRFISAFTLPTMSRASPAGPSSPYQVSTSKPLSPDSSMVGTSGTAAERFSPDMASARSRPDCTCGMAGSMALNIMVTWPPSRSAVAGAAPLYGT